MSRSFSTLSVALFMLFFSLAPFSVFAQSFNRLELVEVSTPANFQNSISYAVSYFAELNGHKVEVFPLQAEKEKDFDLILAQVVRHYIENEYENKGKHLDENSVDPSTPQEIRHLVGTSFLTPAWGDKGQKELARYLQQNSSFLQLHKITAYLDYMTDKGDFESGIDVDPILFRFGRDATRDRVTIIQISQSND